LVSCATKLLTGIWEDHNEFLHGSKKMEAAKKLRERILQRTMELYMNPPILHHRYPKITKVTLEERLKRSTIHLQRWLSRVDHQLEVTRHLEAERCATQPTLATFFTVRVQGTHEKQKFPP